MRRILIAALVFVTTLTAHSPASSSSKDYVMNLDDFFPGCTVRRCVISHSYGGALPRFEDAMTYMVSIGIRHVVIDGECFSACASVMDRIRELGVDLCITKRAELRFHKVSWFKTDEFDNVIFVNGERVFDHYADPPTTKAVREFIERRGGFPIATSYQTQFPIHANDGLFRVCSKKDLGS